MLKNYTTVLISVLALLLTSCNGNGRGGMSPSFSGYPDTPFTIHDASQLIGGPCAQGRVGDVLMDNDRIRVIIQKPIKNAGVNSFGGNIIDADVIGGNGDHFGSLFPLINAEWTVNYHNYEAIADGTDGGSKILRAYGRIDVYDYLNLSFIADIAQGMVGQQVTWSRRFDDRGDPFDIYDDLRGVEHEVVTEYRLDPGTSYIRIDTTLRNNGDEDVFMPVGEFINGSGALQFLIPGMGFAPALMNQVAGDTPGLIYAGLPETNVSYGYFYDPQSFVDEETGERLKTGSLTFSGVTGILLGEEFMKILAVGAGGQPDVKFSIPAEGERTITRYFVVGDGSARSVYEEALKIFGVSTRKINGTVEDASGQPIGGATVAVKKKGGGTIVTLVTDANGQFAVDLPHKNDMVSKMLGGGIYDIAVDKVGYHLNGSQTAGSCEPSEVDLTTAPGAAVSCTVGETGTVTIVGGVADADTGLTMPARLTIVGEDPSPEGSSVGSFRDINVYHYPFGVVDVKYLALDGSVGFTGTSSFDIEPGTYLFVFSHGAEYTSEEREVIVPAGGQVSVEGVALKRVVPTPGYVSVDFHHHSIVSPDSWVPQRNRVLNAAAEGMDVLLASDHDYLNDYGPFIKEVEGRGLVVPGTLKSIVGDEITPNHYGHFNAYPFKIDQESATNGALDWSESPLDDVSPAPDYVMGPIDIVATLTQDPDRVVQINHIMDNPTGLLAATGWVTSPLYAELGAPPLSSFADPVERRLSYAGGEYDFPRAYGDTPLVVVEGVDAIELAIGYDFPKKQFMESALPTWFNLLNLGVIMTAVADTDSHDECFNLPGLPRNYVASSVDPRDGMGGSATSISEAELVQSVRSRDVIVSAGPFVTVEATTPDGQLGSVGGMISGAEATFTIRAWAPSWAWFDTIEIFANVEPIPIDDETDQPMTGTAADPAQFYQPYHVPRYTYQPTHRFRLTDGSLSTWKEEDGVIIAEVQTTVKVDQDTWVAVMVHGSKDTEGFRSLFPIVTNVLIDPKKYPQTFDPLDLDTFNQDSNVWAPAWALANPIFMDADGDGVFTARYVREGVSPIGQ